MSALTAATNDAMRVQALDGLVESWRFGHEAAFAGVFGRGVADHPGTPSQMELRALAHQLERPSRSMGPPPRWRPNPGFARGASCCAVAKLNAKPDEDGVTDPNEEAAIAALNAALDPEPGETVDRDEITAAHDAVYADDHTLDCVRFEAPPAMSTWCMLPPPTGDCIAPCVYAESDEVCDVGRLPVDAVARAFDVVDLSLGPMPFSTCDPFDPPCNVAAKRVVVEMLTMAWAQLYANADIVEWVACTVYGESARSDTIWEWLEQTFGYAASLADCLVRTVQGDTGFGVTIELHDNLEKGLASWNGIAVSVNLASIGYYYYRPYDATDDPIERFCLITDLAGSILHELVHACPDGGAADNRHTLNEEGDWSEEGSCATSYLIENGYRWAMGQRFPCLRSTVGCCYYQSPNLWMNDTHALPSEPPDGVPACRVVPTEATAVGYLVPRH